MKSVKKQISPSLQCARKTMYAAMQILMENGGSCRYKDIIEQMEQRLDFTPWEMEVMPKPHDTRWKSIFLFYSVDLVKAAYLRKNDGVWYITPEGIEATKQGAESLQLQANALYKQWKAKNKVAITAPNEDTQNEEAEITASIVNLEALENQAQDGIKEYIRAKNAYEFQDLVAALLRGMGYYTPFVAPKGKDGGVDIIAYVDAIGAKTPRIKVQVKHYPETPIGTRDVRSLLGILRDGDIGLFVTSGTFSSDAKREALMSKTYVKLIDGLELIELWQQNYAKLSDEDKALLPLKYIAFVDEKKG